MERVKRRKKKNKADAIPISRHFALGIVRMVAVVSAEREKKSSSYDDNGHRISVLSPIVVVECVTLLTLVHGKCTALQLSPGCQDGYIYNRGTNWVNTWILTIYYIQGHISSSVFLLFLSVSLFLSMCRCVCVVISGYLIFVLLLSVFYKCGPCSDGHLLYCRTVALYGGRDSYIWCTI